MSCCSFDCTELIDLLGENWHFYDIESSYLWTLFLHRSFLCPSIKCYHFVPRVLDLTLITIAACVVCRIMSPFLFLMVFLFPFLFYPQPPTGLGICLCVLLPVLRSRSVSLSQVFFIFFHLYLNYFS